MVVECWAPFELYMPKPDRWSLCELGLCSCVCCCSSTLGKANLHAHAVFILSLICEKWTGTLSASRQHQEHKMYLLLLIYYPTKWFNTTKITTLHSDSDVLISKGVKYNMWLSWLTWQSSYVQNMLKGML